MKNYIAFYKKSDGDFVSVMMITAKDMEEVFGLMQGENWSPNGEARDYIQSLGLSHTSMMVGDRIYDCEESKFYRVDWNGFSEVEYPFLIDSLMENK